MRESWEASVARQESFSAAGLTGLKDSSRKKSEQECQSSKTLKKEAQLGRVKGEIG